LLVLIVVVKVPSIYALMVIFQHEEKPLLLSCIIIDIAYLFLWIIFWLILTLKREWNFKVIHQAHEIISLQSGHQTMANILLPSASDKNITDLKNALILMHGEQMYITDDPTVKQNILRYAQRGTTSDEIYWLRSNGAQSPSTRKIPFNENMKGTPEMNRLLGNSAMHRRCSDTNSSPTAAYQSITRSVVSSGMQAASNHHTYLDISKYNYDSGHIDDKNISNTFGTLQRNPRTEYMSSLNRQSNVQLKRKSSAQGSINSTFEHGRQAMHSDAYASIHKGSLRTMIPQTDTMAQRKIPTSKEEPISNSTYSNNRSPYDNNYSTYVKLPQQTRALHSQEVNNKQNSDQPLKNVGNVFGLQQMMNSQRNPSENEIPSSIGSIGASPVGETRLRTSISCRESSPYQRSTNLKLSSFTSHANDSNDSQKQLKQALNAPCTSIGWSQRFPQPSNQQSSVQWLINPAYNKASTGSTDSGQHEPCFSPTSTLTSQGSASNASNYSSHHTPVPNSPNTPQNTSGFVRQSGGANHYNFSDNSDLYGNVSNNSIINHQNCNTITVDEQELTLRAKDQKPLRNFISTGNTSVRHQIRVIQGSRQDSANYSLNSNETATENMRTGDGDNSTDTVDFATSIV
uniref:PH domain-containing protein n=1 Tax=Dracunculus medinensis TaxID=318479 RepID=A0A0N4UHM3_DRAME